MVGIRAADVKSGLENIKQMVRCQVVAPALFPEKRIGEKKEMRGEEKRREEMRRDETAEAKSWGGERSDDD